MKRLRTTDDRAVSLSLSLRTSTLNKAHDVINCEFREGKLSNPPEKLARAVAEYLTRVIEVRWRMLKERGQIIPEANPDEVLRPIEIPEELPAYAIDPNKVSDEFDPRKMRDSMSRFKQSLSAPVAPPPPAAAPAAPVDVMALLTTLVTALSGQQPAPAPVSPPPTPAPPPAPKTPSPRVVPNDIQNFFTHPESASRYSNPWDLPIDPLYWAPPGTPVEALYLWTPNSENVGRNPILREAFKKAREWCVDPESAKKRAAEAAGFKEPTDADYERAMNNSLLASFESREKTEPTQSQANSHANTLDDESEVPGLDAVNAEAAEGIDWSKVP